jgi:hypothetical protein
MTAPKIFGAEPSTSMHGIESGTVSLIISFFTAVVVNVLILTGSDIDVLIYMIAILFLWTIIRNIFGTISDALKITRILTYNPLWDAPDEESGLRTDEDAQNDDDDDDDDGDDAGDGSVGLVAPEDDGWSDNLRVLMDFISKIVVILPFQYGSKLIMNEWMTVGVTTVETMILLFIIAVIFFPAYLWIDRSWKSHSNYERAQFRALMATVH